MKSVIIFFLVLFFLQDAFSQKVDLVGHEAAPVVFQESLDNKINPNFYKNKILVLDFWATWCAPCIAGFPDFNKLSKKYSAPDIVFASLTDEPANVARKFFSRTKKELDAVKLSDTSRKTGNGFNVESIPYCVIIGKDNIVKWAGQSYELTAGVLDKIIENATIAEVPLLNKTPLPQNKPIEQRASFSFSAAKSDTTKRSYEGGGFSRNYGSYYFELSIVNNSLGECLQKLTGFSRYARIVTNDSTKLKQHIDLYFKTAADTTLYKHYSSKVLKGAPSKDIIVSLLGQSFKFDSKLSLEKRKHYELVIIDTAKLHSFKSMQEGHSSFSDDYLPKFEIVGYNLKAIAVELEGSMKTLITTKITDANRYDISLDISNIETTNKTLSFHGLNLKEVDDEVEFLTVNFY